MPLIGRLQGGRRGFNFLAPRGVTGHQALWRQQQLQRGLAVGRLEDRRLTGRRLRLDPGGEGVTLVGLQGQRGYRVDGDAALAPEARGGADPAGGIRAGQGCRGVIVIGRRILRHGTLVIEVIDQAHAGIEDALAALGRRSILVTVIQAELVRSAAGLHLGQLDPDQGHFIDGVEFLQLKLQRGLVIHHETDVLAAFRHLAEIGEVAGMQTNQDRKVRQRLLDIRPGDALRVVMHESVSYSSDGEVIEEKRSISVVKSVIKQQQIKLQ